VADGESKKVIELESPEPVLLVKVSRVEFCVAEPVETARLVESLTRFTCIEPEELLLPKTKEHITIILLLEELGVTLTLMPVMSVKLVLVLEKTVVLVVDTTCKIEPRPTPVKADPLYTSTPLVSSR
jgi:hypothetical protein